MITIAKLGADRWVDYRELRLEALQSEPLAYASSYDEEKLYPEAMWRDRTKNALFALDNDKPVGLAVVFRNSRLKTNHICEIYAVYVRKEYRGRGIGKQLIEAALAEIQSLDGVTKVKIGVNPMQKTAEHIYRKYGFKVAGQLKKEMRVDGKFYDELWMEKYL